MRHLIATAISWAREAAWYAWYKASGASYADYYARRMNSIVRRNPAWGLNIDRTFQLAFLVRHGLQPGSHMLDYGCGALAAGVHFINYLDAGKYVGADISQAAIDEGVRRVAQRGLGGKRPRLQFIRGTSLDELAGSHFDVVWAQSVLTHMPPQDIRSLLQNLRPLLAVNGAFYATFARAETLCQRRFKDWFYPPELMRAMATETGYAIEFLSEWKHPHDPEGNDTMMRLTPLNKERDRTDTPR